MNYIYKSSLIALFIASLTSCDSFLDKQPLSQETNDSFFSSETNANSGVIGMYRTMTSSFAWGQTVLTLPEFSAGHIAHASAFPEYENFATHTVTVINPWTSNVWQGVYSTINAANNIILRVPEIPENSITTEKRNQFVGEAKFVRALSYFFLVRAFGHVPLKLTATTEEEDQIAIPQAAPEEIYTQIVSDLTEAQEQLPESHSSTETSKGRATKAAAQALLAKVYLYQAAFTNDYSLAAATAEAVITSGAFELVSNYGSIWEAENTAESIFELQFDDQTTNPLALVSNDNASMLFYVRDTTIADLFQPTDNRRDFSVVEGSNNRSYLGKFPNFNPPSQNVPIIRLAEILLIHAEAQARVSNSVSQAAYNSLNLVLTRANVAKPISDFTSVDAFIRFVQEEKEREMLFEGETWFDFCRTGLALEKYDTISSENSFLYPIPSTQLAINPNLQQNDGY
ncbi:RagB/SusD family nutrient uptake outer membrane protein [Sphingobacterium oryzagri]|uniref:RagB/SusD family nutrient uptake outer membrane protein n=1 Tax=Sphingobacterium oryzagri TaxID=3025669 RepID=A0ABY7WMD9_9SPHI|nr:RagB/SusD family nutrient uptake outer membrane protein [Sphingobacterium sp. KACC 22765]WDF69822.1 RagB/SusD family nutrient uptake outer membrane protein [Sphingobacterium sp. KACC 22765]